MVMPTRFLSYSLCVVCMPYVSVGLRSVGRLKDKMAEICVRAVLSVADLERKDVNLDLIKVCAHVHTHIHRRTHIHSVVTRSLGCRSQAACPCGSPVTMLQRGVECPLCVQYCVSCLFNTSPVIAVCALQSPG